MGTTPTNGVIFMNSTVSDRTIKDGMSHTIIFGESVYGFWGDALSCCARVPLSSDGRPTFDYVSEPQNAGGNTFLIFGFGSWHDQVAHFAMADGSAKDISKSIDDLVMQALATRDGNERVSDIE